MLTTEDVRRVVQNGVAVGLRKDLSARKGSAVSPRDVEFALGREAAVAALVSLGLESQSIPVGPRGAPLWPDGVVGSITHTAGLAVAVAAGAIDRAAIGIDVERQDRLIDERTFPRIFTESELKRLSTRSNERDRLALFCAKEATYKALSGFVPKLGWHDVDFSFDGDGQLTGVLSARAASFAPVASVSARVLVAGGFVVVCVEIPGVNPASQVPSARAGTARGARDSR